ncbi:hypothetical protein SDC9_203936 [bioreactor metagenome]|uniref:Uncharacterized protein n=1 Tax=bioreactor metagenome TaxID=1076179 RepID=A0A645IZB5_9ZZZZ
MVVGIVHQEGIVAEVEVDFGIRHVAVAGEQGGDDFL